MSDTYNEITWTSLDDSGNDFDTDGWEWITYVTGAKDSRHSHDELPNDGHNRWAIQSYFTKKPSVDTDGDNNDDVDIYRDGSEFFIDVAPESNGESGDDVDLSVLSERPDNRDADSTNYSFSVSIGYGFASVSASVSASTNLDRQTYDLNDDHRYSHWEMSPNPFPTSQDDNNGVWFTVHPSTGEDYESFEASSTYHWEYREQDSACDPGRTIYVDQTISIPFDVPIVEV